MRRSASRTVIGGSNRRLADAALVASPAPHRPRAPVVLAAPTVAELPRQPGMAVVTGGVDAGGSRQHGEKIGDVSTAALTTGPQILHRRRPQSGDMLPSRERLAANPPVRRPTTGERRTLSGTEMQNGKTLSGHQEAVLQTVTEHFSRRPLEQMRNAFRSADVDYSGELDRDEFRKAMKSLNAGLSVKDVDTLFAITDVDGGGTVGIDEFFVNLRHDHWPRERFFWSKQAGGTANLSKPERFALASRLTQDFEQPTTLTTPAIMKVLAEKVAVHGSAEKVFRVIDTNLNGAIDADEIPEALRPYELHVNEQQAAEVLSEINRIAGNPPTEPMTYSSFALAFNPTVPPEALVSLAFQDVPRSELVRRREPADQYEYPALGPERSLESLHSFPRASSIETIGHMRSISTLQPTPPLSHAASRATFKGIEQELSEHHFDQMSGWRGAGDDAIDGGGGELGKRIMGTGRAIDWKAYNKQPSKLAMYEQASTRASAELTPLEMVSTIPSRVGSSKHLHASASERTVGARVATAATTPPKSGESGDGRPPTSKQGFVTEGSQRRSASLHSLPHSTREAATSPHTNQPSLSSLSPSMTNSTLVRSRSRLSLTLESYGSRSSAECLYPGAASHHHISEDERLAHTSSIASLRAVSSAITNGQPDAEQAAQKERRRQQLGDLGRRQAERGSRMQVMIEQKERRAVDRDGARARLKARYERRMGEHQLVQLTRECENGKAPIALEAPPDVSWVSAPPHLSSHWHTISSNLCDPPARESVASLRSSAGRRSFTEAQLHRGESRGVGKFVWGGAFADEGGERAHYRPQI